MYVLALVVSGGIAFAIGNRGTALSSLAILLVLPTFWGMLQINLRLFPVRIEIVRAGWTPGDSDRDRELEQEFDRLRELDPVIGDAESETPAPALEESTDNSPGQIKLSIRKDSTVTFEGFAIALALTALLAYHVYMAIEPHLN